MSDKSITDAVHYFHQVDDPYSHLAVQTLAALAAAYRIEIVPHLVPPPDDSAAPERARLKAYALRDAARVARRYGLSYPDRATERDAESVRIASARLAHAIERGMFVREASSIGDAFWRGMPSDAEAADAATTQRSLTEGEKLRDELGHYLGAMFYFNGDWYWGIDRLHHLESRLRSQGLANDPAGPLVAPVQQPALDGPRASSKPPLVEFWFSFRSPYVYIGAARLHRLAAYYGAEVRWRFIIPMIMRGLPVPPAKTRYTLLDAMREGALHGVSFGRIVDPMGAGSDRVTAVLHRAIAVGKGAIFTELGLKAVFHDGIDLATDAGLLKLTESAGLTETEMRAALADESWRAVAEENRRGLLDAGLWGAPTYRVNGGPAHWGQDRLWALEEDLNAAIAGG
jgi:2-hydroxychromene-2-carboxylate isomerase